MTGWVWGETLNLAKIYLLVWGVMLLQRGIDFFRVSDLLGRALHPVLRLLGISPRAAAVIIVGFGMGLTRLLLAMEAEGALPALDGGRVFFLILNGLVHLVSRRRIPARYEGYVHAAGMVLLLGLSAYVMYNDIARLIK